MSLYVSNVHRPTCIEEKTMHPEKFLSYVGNKLTERGENRLFFVVAIEITCAVHCATNLMFLNAER